jgi:hypothetical protein
MNKEIPKTTAQGTEARYSEMQLGAAFFTQPVAETVRALEPSFDKVQHLYSNKPLRFRRAAKLPQQ